MFAIWRLDLLRPAGTTPRTSMAAHRRPFPVCDTFTMITCAVIGYDSASTTSGHDVARHRPERLLDLLLTVRWDGNVNHLVGHDTSPTVGVRTEMQTYVRMNVQS